MTHDDVLEACKQIITAEKVLNDAVDELLHVVGITKEEATNGNFHKKIDT